MTRVLSGSAKQFSHQYMAKAEGALTCMVSNRKRPWMRKPFVPEGTARKTASGGRACAMGLVGVFSCVFTSLSVTKG